MTIYLQGAALPLTDDTATTTTPPKTHDDHRCGPYVYLTHYPSSACILFMNSVLDTKRLLNNVLLYCFILLLYYLINRASNHYDRRNYFGLCYILQSLLSFKMSIREQFELFWKTHIVYSCLDFRFEYCVTIMYTSYVYVY